MTESGKAKSPNTKQKNRQIHNKTDFIPPIYMKQYDANHPVAIKKRILFIMNTLRGGGAEKVLSDILKHFNYSNYEVTLALIHNEGVYRESIPYQVELLYLDQIKIPTNRLLVNRFTLKHWHRYKIERLLKDRAFDTIISFMEGASVYWHQFVLKRADKNISWVHIDLYNLHWTRRFFKSDKDECKAYSNMDKIIFVSHESHAQFEKLFGRKFPSSVIYNIIDKENIIQKGAEEIPCVRKAKFVVCNVGRLCPQKRQDRLIRAIAKLRNIDHIDVEAWILGEGALLDDLKKLSFDLRISDNIRFMGFQKNPYKYIKNADIFVLSSDAEGYGLVVSESLCLGIPVISTNITGPAEILAENSGILVELSSDAIAEAIKELISNPKKFDYYRNRAIDRASIFDPLSTMGQIYKMI